MGVMVASCQVISFFSNCTMEMCSILYEGRKIEGKYEMKEVAKHIECETGHKCMEELHRETNV